MSDTGGLGPNSASSAGGRLPAELPADVSVLYNTIAVIALSVTRLFSRLSSPSTPLYNDPHALRKLVRSSSSTGQDTKTGGSSDSLTGAWRKMLLLDGVELDFPPRSTCPAFSSSPAKPLRAYILASQATHTASKKQVLLYLQTDGPGGADTYSLPTSPMHSPERGRSCSPHPRPSSSWVTLPCPEPPLSVLHSTSQSRPTGTQACIPHTSSTSTSTSPALRIMSGTVQLHDLAPASADSARPVMSAVTATPTVQENTALAASVLVEVRSMLRAMKAPPAKGVIAPSSPTAHNCSSFESGGSCGAATSLSSLPLYNSCLQLQLGTGPAVGRGGFGSVYSGVWEGEEVAIKRVPFNAISAQRRITVQPDNLACSTAKGTHSWRLPNGILMECAHAIVLGGGCSSVCFNGIVQLRCWAISPLEAPIHDSNTHELLLVMPLLRRSLDQALQQHLSLQDALDAALDVASAACSLHSRNVVHGDLKCANAMQASNGTWLLLDFGLAATLKGSMRSAAARGSSQGHASPELLADGRISTATDVFAVGVMLSRVLTHKSVLRGAPVWWTAAVTMAGVLTPIAGAAERLAHEADADVSVLVHLLQLLQQAQTEQPSARPTMPQLLEAIEAAADCVDALFEASTAAGCVPNGPGSSASEQDEQAMDVYNVAEGEGPDGCSSSPTFSTITTDPAWSSSTSESEEEGDGDDTDVEQGTE